VCCRLHGGLTYQDILACSVPVFSRACALTDCQTLSSIIEHNLERMISRWGRARLCPSPASYCTLQTQGSSSMKSYKYHRLRCASLAGMPSGAGNLDDLAACTGMVQTTVDALCTEHVMDSIAAKWWAARLAGLRPTTHLSSVREARKPGNPAPHRSYQARNLDMTCRRYRPWTGLDVMLWPRTVPGVVQSCVKVPDIVGPTS